ncbi:MAG: hypothetical protein ACOYMD_12460 [Paludibacter sp.]
MKKKYKMTKKRAYSSPDVICIKMDNEISLALESANPDGDPTFSSNQQFFINDPFKSNMG